MSAPTHTPVRTATATRRPAKPRPSGVLIAGLLIALLITVWGGRGIEFTLSPLLSDSGRGWVIIQQFFVPEWGFIFRVWPAWVQTLSIAVIASVIGCALGLGFAMCASKVTMANRGIYHATKTLLSVVRSLPDIAYVLIFVAIVSVGSLAGILALIFFNVGIAAKLTSETIDAVDPGPLEAADAAGANRVQRAWSAVIPQIWPNYLSYCFYIFELNIRASVVIGIGGGGGIGQVIRVELARFNYENIAAITVALFVVVFTLDQISQAARRRFV